MNDFFRWREAIISSNTIDGGSNARVDALYFYNTHPLQNSDVRDSSLFDYKKWSSHTHRQQKACHHGNANMLLHCWEKSGNESIAGRWISFDITLTTCRLLIQRCSYLTLWDITNLLHKWKYLDSQNEAFSYSIWPLNLAWYLYTMLVWCQRWTLCDISTQLSVRSKGSTHGIYTFISKVSVLVKLAFSKFSEIGRGTVHCFGEVITTLP